MPLGKMLREGLPNPRVQASLQGPKLSVDFSQLNWRNKRLLAFGLKSIRPEASFPLNKLPRVSTCEPNIATLFSSNGPERLIVPVRIAGILLHLLAVIAA